MVSDLLTLLNFLHYRALYLCTQNCGVQPTAVLFVREPFANSATGRQQYLDNILTAGYKRHNELKSQKLEIWSCFLFLVSLSLRMKLYLAGKTSTKFA